MHSFELFVIILIFGGLLMLAFIQFVNPNKVNVKGNIAFGIFLLIWSTFWLEEVGEMIGDEDFIKPLEIPIRFVQFLTALFFYYSVAYYSTPNYKLFPKVYKHMVMPIIYLALLVLENNRPDGVGTYYSFITFFILAQSLFYAVISYLRIQKHKKNIRLFASNTDEIDLNWIENIIKLILFLIFAICIYEMLFDSDRLNIVLNFISFYIVFFVGINVIKQKEIYFSADNQKEDIELVIEDGMDEKKLLPDEELQLYMKKVDELMREKKVYLENDLNLIKLAEMVDLSPHQLSYVINKGFKNNFFQYVNAFRVEKAKEMLLKMKEHNLTILGIAYESGFNSKTAFYTMFKKLTGLTPSEFIKKNAV